MQDLAERKEGAGRTALITGASSGIGLELSRLFAADRYDLVVVGRSVEKLKALVTQLESQHEVRVRACPIDLSQPHAVHALWSELTNAGVAVDVLVNNAGVGLYGELWEQDADELCRMLVLNVEVLTLLTRYALPGMIARSWGRILNLASLVAYQPGGPRRPITARRHTCCRFRRAWRLSCAEPGLRLRLCALASQGPSS